MGRRRWVAGCIIIALTLAAGSLACAGESCDDALWYFSGATGNKMPDAAMGAACTLTVSVGDASLQVNIDALDGGWVATPCSSPSLPPGALECEWTAGLESLIVQTLDTDAGRLVNGVLGNPSDRDASAVLTCNGKPIAGASTHASLHKCYL